MKWIVWTLPALLLVVPDVASAIDFDADIRPLLSDKCFHCHGPDGATREAGLRLDTREGAIEDLGGYAAITPGDSEQSEVILRITSDDPDALMPPPESKLKLSDSEKRLLAEWIDSGAEWSTHWSFVPPKSPPLPAADESWCRNAIDHFVFARARQAGLSMQGEADRETLLRRLTLDLTGLPPTPAEMDAFLEDDSEGAYERAVDRLLDSPRYGERMAWEWMDAARYADTDGFQGDPTRTMWPWRDWLVRALNDNMPFDQFTTEMLAGDLLADATPEQVLATGFNRNHMFNGEGGRIAEETRIENVFDRAETTGTVWLGLTMTCCRCHDHKYDPISQKEYFELFAFFNGTSENGRSGRGKTAPVINYLPPDQRSERERLTAALAERNAELAAPMPELDERQSQWEAGQRDKLGAASGISQLGEWSKLGPITSPGRRAFNQDLGPEKKLDLEAEYAEKKWTRQPDQKDGVVVALPDTVGATYFHRVITAPSPRSMSISLGSDDAIKVFLNGKEILANFAARAAAADQESAILKLNKGANDLLIKIVNTGGIGGFYFRKKSESLLGLPEDVVAALSAGKPNAKQKNRLRDYYRSKHWDGWKSKADARDKTKKQLDQVNGQAVTVMVMDTMKSPRKTLILDRGGYDKPTDVEVTAGTPAALPPLPASANRDRLALAHWLMDPEHPLTARVTVNRYWQTFFGKGIVTSTEDFGVQGSRPTHPELLDWLATEFVSSGWNVKQLHKLIVMSATYRQSAVSDEKSRELDPENKWYARSPRYRMPSWMLRDQALAASGLMNGSFGGPPVKTYQPEGIWAEATFGKIRYKRDSGDKLYRRSLYVFWRRIVGPTMFFDGAKRQTCEVKPTRTNTPLHALTTLNETTFVEASRALAQRVMSSRSGTDERIRRAFRLVTGRFPTDDERSILVDRFEILRQDFADHPEQAVELLGVGESDRNESLNPAEHAALAMVCSVILNLDETLSRP